MHHKLFVYAGVGVKEYNGSVLEVEIDSSDMLTVIKDGEVLAIYREWSSYEFVE